LASHHDAKRDNAVWPRFTGENLYPHIDEGHIVLTVAGEEHLHPCFARASSAELDRFVQEKLRSLPNGGSRARAQSGGMDALNMTLGFLVILGTYYYIRNSLRKKSRLTRQRAGPRFDVGWVRNR
jgi:hypothetical protein